MNSAAGLQRPHAAGHRPEWSRLASHGLSSVQSCALRPPASLSSQVETTLLPRLAAVDPALHDLQGTSLRLLSKGDISNDCCVAAHLAWQTALLSPFVSPTLGHRCHGRRPLMLPTAGAPHVSGCHALPPSPRDLESLPWAEAVSLQTSPSAIQPKPQTGEGDPCHRQATSR